MQIGSRNNPLEVAVATFGDLNDQEPSDRHYVEHYYVALSELQLTTDEEMKERSHLNFILSLNSDTKNTAKGYHHIESNGN